ncbi:putative polygalacturonase [Canna indica]|uniref:Polygalacturonase n=1 Tax=Canna indica TaxID=4628 RepID=A0AAQ3L5E6_9LILI|nr:putative polygalacturonase [Canna indica]
MGDAGAAEGLGCVKCLATEGDNLGVGAANEDVDDLLVFGSSPHFSSSPSSFYLSSSILLSFASFPSCFVFVVVWNSSASISVAPCLKGPHEEATCLLRLHLLLVLIVAVAVEGNGSGDGYCNHKSSLSPRPHSVTITEFGAVGDGVTLNTVAFQNAVFYLRSFADKGGAQLYVPKGRWLTGSFNLTSHLTLFLNKDAIIIGSQDSSQWPIVDPLPSYGQGLDLPGARHRSLINGYNLTDVVITGDNGTIDGQGSVWWDWFNSHNLNNSRPHLLELVSSSNIVISNLTFLNPPAWSIHPVYSSNVTIQNISIQAASDSPYTNGIVPDSCSNVCIKDCSLSVGYDAIALKSGWDNYGISFGLPSSHIQITNVHLQASLGSALAFGSEMSGGISDVQVEHLHVHNSLTAIKFKTTRGRGGFIKDIAISDMEMEDVQEAFVFTGHCGGHPDDQYDSDALPIIKRVTIKNVVGSNISIAGVLSGIDQDPFTAICLANINLSMTSQLSNPWTCSNVFGFSDSVFPQPCSDLNTNSSLLCFSLDNSDALAEI